jgi:GxxExxY protein
VPDRYGGCGGAPCPTTTALDPLTDRILAAAFAVHTELGPGLLEATYEICLARELELRGLHVQRQVALPVAYKGVTVEAAYRIDLLVEGRVVIEVKSVERLARIHLAQVLTYLRLTKLPVGILLDFNEERLRDGIRRLGNTLR